MKVSAILRMAVIALTLAAMAAITPISPQAAAIGSEAPLVGIWYVAPGGDDTNSCTSPTAPCATINGAIGKVSAGDTIYVAEGTYTGGGDQVILPDKDIVLSGGWNNAFSGQTGASIVDGQQARRGVTVNSGKSVTIDRFIFQHGKANSGGGISNEGVLVLNDSTLRHNAALECGGGIATGGTLTVNRSAIHGNSSPAGSGVCTGGEAQTTLNQSSITGNDDLGQACGGYFVGATIYMNGIWQSLLTLNNSTVSDNAGAAINLHYVRLALNNVTISNNTGGICGGSAELTLQNTIVAGNTEGGNHDLDFNGIMQSHGYNLIGNPNYYPNPGPGDLINVDPHLGNLLEFPNSPAYQVLLLGSPAIDAGNPGGCTGSAGTLTTDQRGASRVGRCDIGAYEYTTPGSAASVHAVGDTPHRVPPLNTFSSSLRVAVLDAIGSPVGGVTVSFNAPAAGPSGTFADSGTHVATAMTNASGLATAATFVANAQSGTYDVSATANGVASPEHFPLTNFGWYVSSSGSDTNACTSPGAACACVNGVQGKPDFEAGDSILVAVGTYTGPSDQVVLLNKSAIVSGGWNSTFTEQNGMSIIDGEGARRGITVSAGVVASVERFRVQGGCSVWPDCSANGGGILNSGSLTLRDSAVSNNRASFGGGIVNSGIMRLDNSTVRDNIAEGGGGIGNFDGTLTLDNSAVVGNKAATLGGGDGGGIGVPSGGIVTLNNSTVSGNVALGGGGGVGILWDSPQLILNNTTISHNTAVGDGGGVNGGTLILRNSIVAGNTAGNGPDCAGDSPPVTLGYNLIGDTSACNLAPGTGDLTGVSPKLGQLTDAAGRPMYYPLLPGSPAIDAGDPEGCVGSSGPLPTDQRGAARVGRCDIGAYEYTVSGPPVSITAFGGTPQSIPPLHAFREPLRALVLDSIGSPVDGTVVTFAAPSSGASGTFADTGTHTVPAVTGADGSAAAPALTANGITGNYIVAATVGSVAMPASFDLANMSWYVSSSGSDANACTTPSAPCATINGAFNRPSFVPSGTILVSAGTYTGVGDEVVLLDRDAVLSGGWNDSFTAQVGLSTLDGGYQRRGVTVQDDVTAIIERFAVQRGGSPYAGGIRNDGTLALNDSVVSDSGSDYGGGIANDWNLTLNNSSVSGNGSSNAGGGIRSQGRLILNNSTVSGNVAPYAGGISFGGHLELNSSTVTHNNIGVGGGTAVVRNSIIAGNDAEDCRMKLVSAGYNLIGKLTSCEYTPGPGDLLYVDPGLGPMQGNPGYYPLLASSPARNAGDPTGCTDGLGDLLTTDQRGKPRAGRCDIGAYEIMPLEFSTKSADISVLDPGQRVNYTIVLDNIEVFEIADVRVTDTLPSLLAYVLGSLSATVGTYDYQDGTVTWQGPMPADERVTITFGAQAGIKPGQATNTATISGAGEVYTRSATVHVRQFTYLPLVLKNR